MSQLDRRPGLDVIRSAAILLVMAHHFRHLPGAPAWFDWIAMRGYIGVDLFFVLSGWLIGGQLLRELRTTGSVNLARFWAKRWFRTLPAYYAVLFLVFSHGAATIPQFAGMMIFAQNYLSPHLWLVTWSLCIEEHFYLALPLLALMVVRLPRPWAWPVAAAAILASPLLRWAAFPQMAAGTMRDFLGDFYSPTHLRLEGLVLGVATAAVAQYARVAWAALERRAGALCAAGVAVVIASNWNPWLTGWTGDGNERMGFYAAVLGFLLVSVGTTMMLPFAARTASPRLVWLPFTWTAEHAYTLYLTHGLVPSMMERAVPEAAGFWPRLILNFVGSFVAAAMLRQLAEIPGLALRDRLLPAPRQRVVATGAPS